QMICQARPPDRQLIPGIQAEKPDPWLFAFEPDIGAHVEFRERRRSGNWRQIIGALIGNPKWDDPKPGLPIKRVYLQTEGNHRVEIGGIYRPVGKHQVAPDLHHQPWAVRQRPGPMTGIPQDFFWREWWAVQSDLFHKGNRSDSTQSRQGAKGFPDALCD